MMKVDELANQLKSQSLNVVSPSAFLQVGGPVFPDDTTKAALMGFEDTVRAFRAVHCPTFGHIIPGTGESIGRAGTGTILTPTGNQVYRIDSFEISNGGGSAPVTCQFTIDGVPINNAEQGAALPGSSVVISGPHFIDSGLPLGIVTVSGEQADMSCKVLVALVVQ